MGNEQSDTFEAPDGDVVTTTEATSSTAYTETKTEPEQPDRSGELPADQLDKRGDIRPNKKG